MAAETKRPAKVATAAPTTAAPTTAATPGADAREAATTSLPGACPSCVSAGGFRTCDMAVCRRVLAPAADGAAGAVLCGNAVPSGCIQRCAACSARFGECERCARPFGALASYRGPVLARLRASAEDMRREEVWCRRFHEAAKARRLARAAAGVQLAAEELRAVEKAARDREEEEWARDPTFVPTSRYMRLRFARAFARQYERAAGVAEALFDAHALPPTEVTRFAVLWRDAVAAAGDEAAPGSDSD